MENNHLLERESHEYSDLVHILFWYNVVKDKFPILLSLYDTKYKHMSDMFPKLNQPCLNLNNVIKMVLQI